MEYPLWGDNKLYSKGLTLTLDLFTELDEIDTTLMKDYKKRAMFESGKHEDEGTPMSILNQPKILLHKRNEIPSFLSTRTKPLTLSSNKDYTVAEVKIPMKVNISLMDLLYTQKQHICNCSIFQSYPNILLEHIQKTTNC